MYSQSGETCPPEADGRPSYGRQIYLSADRRARFQTICFGYMYYNQKIE